MATLIHALMAMLMGAPNGNIDTYPDGNIDTCPDGNTDVCPNVNIDVCPGGNIDTCPDGNRDACPDGNIEACPNGNIDTYPDAFPQTMDQSMGAAMTLSAPTDQVEALITQVAEENGLEVIDQLKELHAPSASVASTSKTTDQAREDDLSRR